MEMTHTRQFLLTPPQDLPQAQPWGLPLVYLSGQLGPTGQFTAAPLPPEVRGGLLLIGVSEAPQPGADPKHAAQAIRGLKAEGVEKTVMLTGDADAAAQQVASQLGVDEVHSQLLPADKVRQVERLLKERREGRLLAFVGDGINDAPVLARADIGIAMGALGSDAAIEAADVVLMDDDPAKIALAMRISRRTLRIVYENIVFALAGKAVVLLMGAAGVANMWEAVVADVGVSVIAILNAMRALRTK